MDKKFLSLCFLVMVFVGHLQDTFSCTQFISIVSLGSGVSKERKAWKDYANQGRSTREKQEIGIEELQGFRVYTGYCGAE
jgi:hypothetical protein